MSLCSMMLPADVTVCSSLQGSSLPREEGIASGMVQEQGEKEWDAQYGVNRVRSHHPYLVKCPLVDKQRRRQCSLVFKPSSNNSL